MKKQSRFIILCILLFSTVTLYASGGRIKEKFDFDWKFQLQDIPDSKSLAYNDASWEDIQIPHDWSIKLEFDPKVGGSPGFIPGGIGWYRKTFQVPESYRGKKVTILFDAVFHQSDVYINGIHLGFRPYGFVAFEYDLTPHLNYGDENVIAVRVDHQTNGTARWYAGSGIYRHVWLQVTEPIHVTTWGTYVTTPFVGESQADVQIVTTLENYSEQPQRVTLLQYIVNSAGKRVVQSTETGLSLTAGEKQDITQNLALSNPLLWDIDSPHLYTIETVVKAGRRIVDTYQTTFGVRTFEFDSRKGFFLNGRPVKLQGMCLHHDAGSLGTAVPERFYERRLEILKEYGCNAIRSAHNQPSPEFLDLCDRMGFLVIDEAFDKGKSGYYEKYFDEWWERDLENMLIRDRNHPSIILWSFGNEVQEAWNSDDEGIERASMLQDFVHRLDPTRPATLAAQNGHNGRFSAVADVIGYNYLEARMLTDHKNNPSLKFLVSEELPYYSGEEGRIRSYTPYNPWNLVAAHDFIAGGFIWSGVDYLGEAAAWPSKGWPNGLFDLCTFEKPRAAYHRAMWNPEPIVRIAVADQALDIDHGRDLWQWPKIAAHWNFPANYVGLMMQIHTTTNCESVELFLDNKSMGHQRTADFTNNTIIWNLPYTPGKLSAKGYNKDEEVAYYEIRTSGNTEYAVVNADRTEIHADGQDISHLVIELFDAEGIPVQTDDRLITATVTGEGRFMGIDNGDLRREDSFAGNKLKTYFGKALVIVGSTRNQGTMKVNLEIEGIDPPYVVEIQSR